MGPAFDDTGGRNQGNLGILFKVRQVERPTAAHGGDDLSNGDVKVVFQLAGIRYIAIDPFFKFEAFTAVQSRNAASCVPGWNPRPSIPLHSCCQSCSFLVGLSSKRAK